MALPDEEKIRLIKLAFNSKLDSFETYDELKVALSGLTKEKMKSFIRNILQSIISTRASESAALSESAVDVTELDTDVETW